MAAAIKSSGRERKCVNHFFGIIIFSLLPPLKSKKRKIEGKIIFVVDVATWAMFQINF
jgi:hypothetical protein